MISTAVRNLAAITTAAFFGLLLLPVSPPEGSFEVLDKPDEGYTRNYRIPKGETLVGLRTWDENGATIQQWFSCGNVMPHFVVENHRTLGYKSDREWMFQRIFDVDDLEKDRKGFFSNADRKRILRGGVTEGSLGEFAETYEAVCGSEASVEEGKIVSTWVPPAYQRDPQRLLDEERIDLVPDDQKADFRRMLDRYKEVKKNGQPVGVEFSQQDGMISLRMNIPGRETAGGLRYRILPKGSPADGETHYL